MKITRSLSPLRANLAAFTLVEILVVITIVSVLIGLSIAALSKARKTAATVRSFATMKSVLAANVLYSNENSGQIATLRYPGEDKILNPGGKWVGNSFWGQLQPYLFKEITTTNQSQLRQEILAGLTTLFGSNNVSKMTGTPFEGARIYHDTSGLPVPFGFNKYLVPWNAWVRQQQVYSLPACIYMAYGFAQFDEVDLEKYVEMPKNNQASVNNIYYLPSKQAIAGFLDGHVEYLTPPTPVRMVKIDGSAE